LGKSTGNAYSQALRDQVLNARGTIQDLANRFGVSQAYVSKAKTRLRETGDRTARWPRRKLEPHFGALRARVKESPDFTLEELRAWIAAKLNVSVSIGCLWNNLIFLGLRPDKGPTMLPRRTVRAPPRAPLRR
jgi:transposase